MRGSIREGERVDRDGEDDKTSKVVLHGVFVLFYDVGVVAQVAVVRGETKGVWPTKGEKREKGVGWGRFCQ